MEFSFFLLIPPHVRGATHRKWVIALSKKKLGNKETAVLLRHTKKKTITAALVVTTEKDARHAI
jgi:hypothetical protein